MTYLAASLWLLGAVGMWIELAPAEGWLDAAKLVLFCACWPLVIVWAIYRWGIVK